MEEDAALHVSDAMYWVMRKDVPGMVVVARHREAIKKASLEAVQHNVDSLIDQVGREQKRRCSHPPSPPDSLRAARSCRCPMIVSQYAGLAPVVKGRGTEVFINRGGGPRLAPPLQS